jgi:hypothetical protein
MTKVRVVDKGGKIEEVLREYFLDMGFYVIGGARYTYGGIDITDVDLWLYQRASPFSRQRFHVDAKDRRIPHALERVLWAKGLQVCLSLDASIVATTDTRIKVKEFGDLQNISVLDGTFLSKLKKRYGQQTTRLAEEEFMVLIRLGKSDRIGVDWGTRINVAKSRVLTHLNFDGVNSLLNDVSYFVEQIRAVPHRTEAACRCVYLTLSLALIGFDFVGKDFAFGERQTYLDALIEGLRFGSAGKAGAERVFATAGRLVAAYLPEQNLRGADVAKQLRDQSHELPADVLAESIAKAGSGKQLFELARSFEALAFSRTFKPPSEISSEHRGFLGAVLDFLRVDRKQFFDVAPAGQSERTEAASAGQAGSDPEQLEIKISEPQTSITETPPLSR